MLRPGGIFLFQLLLAVFLFLNPRVSAEATPPGIYQAENNWSWAYEEQFGQWLENVASDKEFFKRHNIAIDCADTIYGFRWIFARIHRLPMLSTTTTMGLVSHETEHSVWSGLPTANHWYKDQRFLTALDHILHHTWTETLAEDSYPVQLTALIPGTFFLNLGPSKHVDTIYTSNEDDPSLMPFEFVSSSVPRKVKDTKHLVYWYEAKPKTEREGFRRFIWPVQTMDGWSYMDPKEMPYYSLEQFQLDLGKQNFHSYVYNLAKPNMDLDELALISLRELKSYIQERIQIVNEGYKVCRSSRRHRRLCRKRSSKLYDTWSTPSRDKRIAMHLEATINQIQNSSLETDWKTLFKKTDVFKLKGRQVSLFKINRVWSRKKFKSAPLLSPARRWGLN